MKLSDLKPDSYEVEKPKALKLSDLHPDSYEVHKEDSQQPATEEPSTLESGLRGAAQGATLGLADELTGAGETGLDALSGNTQGKSLMDLYKQHRDESRANYDAAEKANPTVSFLGNLAGGIIPGALTGGIAPVAKGAGVLAKIGNVAGKGAAFGGLAGYGSSTAQDLPGQASDALSGAALGGATGAVAGGIGQGFRKASDMLSRTALGEKLSTAFPMGQAGESVFDKSVRNGVGQETFDEGDKYAKVFGQNKGGLRSETGKQISQAIENAGNPDVDSSKFLDQMNPLVDSLSDKNANQSTDKAKLTDMINRYTREEVPYSSKSKTFSPGQMTNPIETGLPATEIPGNVTENTVSGTVSKPVESLPLDQLQELKQTLQGFTKFQDNGAASTQGSNVASQLTGLLGDVTESAAPGSEQDGIQSLAEANKNFNSVDRANKLLLGKSSTSQDTPAQKLAQLIQNYKDSSKAGDKARFKIDKAKELIGSVNPELAEQFGNDISDTAKRYAVVRAANNEQLNLKSIGSALGVKGANIAGQIASIDNPVTNAISSTSKYLTSIPKEGLATLGQTLSESSEPLTNKLGGVLTQASQRDDVGRNALLFTLMQNPGYRSIIVGHKDKNGTQ